MISRKILFLYLKNFIKNWLVFALLLLSFQTLIDYIKEIKFLAEEYTQKDLLLYLGKNALYDCLDLAPLSLYASIVFTNWQWTQHQLWLAYSVIGTSSAQLRVTILLQSILIIGMTLPGYWFYGPHLRYEGAYERLIKLKRLPEIEVGKHYLQNKTLFYPINDKEIFVFDFKTGVNKLEPWVMSDNRLTLITPSKSFSLEEEINAELGYNRLDLFQLKDSYLNSSEDSVRHHEILVTLINTVLYPFLILMSIFFGWYAAPVQALKRQAKLSSLQIMLFGMLLYSGQKILGLAVCLINPEVIGGIYGSLVLLGLALGIRLRKTH